MWPASSTFLGLVGDGHTIASQVDVCDTTGTVLYSFAFSTADTSDGAGILTGSITEDRTAAIRRQGSLTLTDPSGTLNPRDATDLLMPLGNEIRPYRGVVLPGGGVELAPLGVLGISKPVIAESEDSGVVITLDCYDRARRIQRARWTSAYQVPVGADLADALESLLASRWPQMPPLQAPATATVTGASGAFDGGDGSDPWASAQSLAHDHGFELYFDRYGIPTLSTVADPAGSDPVVTYVRGEAGVVLSGQREIDDEHAYSGVVVVGETSDGTVVARGEAWDDNPDSPTYRFGPFGQVPFFFTSPWVSNNTQAAQTARNLLPLHTGLMETATWTQLVNPALDAGDLVGVTDDVLGFQDGYSAESLVTPLTAADPMTATMAARFLGISV